MLTIFSFSFSTIPATLISWAKILEKDSSSSFSALFKKDLSFFEEVVTLLTYSRIIDEDWFFLDKLTEDFCFLPSSIDFEGCLRCPWFFPLVLRSNALSWFFEPTLLKLFPEEGFLDVVLTETSSPIWLNKLDSGTLIILSFLSLGSKRVVLFSSRLTYFCGGGCSAELSEYL